MDNYQRTIKITIVVLIVFFFFLFFFLFLRYRSLEKEMADFIQKKVVTGLTREQYIQFYPDNVGYFLEGSKELLRIIGEVQTVDNKFIIISVTKGDLLKVGYNQDTVVVDTFPDKDISSKFDKTKMTFTGKEAFITAIDKENNLLLKAIYRFKL